MRSKATCNNNCYDGSARCGFDDVILLSSNRFDYCCKSTKCCTNLGCAPRGEADILRPLSDNAILSWAMIPPPLGARQDREMRHQ